MGICICLVGEGEVGMCGGLFGDFYLFINVVEYELFQCDGIMLFCCVLVLMVDVVLGGDVEVLNIDGGCSCVCILEGS